MPGVRTPSRVLTRRVVPRGLTVWVLALALAVLSPFVVGFHSLIAHPGDAGHAHAAHQPAGSTCSHHHGAPDGGETALTMLPHTGHSHGEPHPSPDRVPAEDCPTCLQLGLAGKFTDLPPAADGLRLGQCIARAASTGPVAARPATPRRAAHPRAPPASA